MLNSTAAAGVIRAAAVREGRPMRIRIVKNTVAQGRCVYPDEVLEVPEHEGRMLCGYGQAERLVTHVDDPKPTPSRRARQQKGPQS